MSKIRKCLLYISAVVVTTLLTGGISACKEAAVTAETRTEPAFILEDGKVSPAATPAHGKHLKDERTGGNKVAAPKLSPRMGVYSHDVEVTITAYPEDAVIYYTTDGSKPGPESPVYEAPIPVSGDGTHVIIKAVAYKEGMKRSSYKTGVYKIRYKKAESRGIVFSSGREYVEFSTEYCGTVARENVLELYLTDINGSAPVQLTRYRLYSEYECDLIQSYAGAADVSPDGSRIVYTYYDDNVEGGYSLYLTSRENTAQHEHLAGHGFAFFTDNPAWSPDGRKIAFSFYDQYNLPPVWGTRRGIATICPDGTDLEVVAEIDEFSRVDHIVWTPDSSSIAYLIDGDIRKMNKDGENNELLFNIGTEVSSFDWSVCNRIVFARNDDIYTMKSDGTDLRQITYTPEREGNPVWSPNGKMIAFERGEVYWRDIYVMNAGGGNVRAVIESDYDDFRPVW